MDETIKQSRERHVLKMTAKAESHEEAASEFQKLADERRARARMCRGEADRHRRLLSEGK
jgi:hypothetical protein